MTAPPCFTYPACPAGLSAALAALGPTAQAVADALTLGGYTGCPGTSTLRASARTSRRSFALRVLSSGP